MKNLKEAAKIVENALQIAIIHANELSNYPDALSLVQDVLQEKQDNNELSPDDSTTLAWVDELIKTQK